MPATTPKLKINLVRHHGGEWLSIVLTGTTFDDAVTEARKFEQINNSVFIHAFDNIHVIEGQGGLAAEILEDWKSTETLDYVFACVGGGGLASGLGCYFKQMAP
jgi:threonine dehydratase